MPIHDVKINGPQTQSTDQLKGRGPQVKKSFQKDGLAIAEQANANLRARSSEVASGKTIALPLDSELPENIEDNAKGALKSLRQLFKRDDSGALEGGLQEQALTNALFARLETDPAELQSIEQNLGSIGHIEGRGQFEQLERMNRLRADAQRLADRLESRLGDDQTQTKLASLASAMVDAQKGKTTSKPEDVAGQLGIPENEAKENVYAQLAAISQDILGPGASLTRALFEVQKHMQTAFASEATNHKFQSLEAGASRLAAQMSGRPGPQAQTPAAAQPQAGAKPGAAGQNRGTNGEF